MSSIMERVTDLIRRLRLAVNETDGGGSAAVPLMFEAIDALVDMQIMVGLLTDKRAAEDRLQALRAKLDAPKETIS